MPMAEAADLKEDAWHGVGPALQPATDDRRGSRSDLDGGLAPQSQDPRFMPVHRVVTFKKMPKSDTLRRKVDQARVEAYMETGSKNIVITTQILGDSKRPASRSSSDERDSNSSGSSARSESMPVRRRGSPLGRLGGLLSAMSTRRVKVQPVVVIEVAPWECPVAEQLPAGAAGSSCLSLRDLARGLAPIY
eukprot:CAMPEP_0204523852 /NCGR_PEP_ID=MMETSP0661-20131031/7065_1 /ASSEMBLY_ACC=CAM_ASM_000606 /TAXON_ID=109239 /ORGANISM="Alexandrium margalefi, Strain AMGDE01CS-322" /LENGTH=190 /DNA_ID=CAMNT_0051529573 /DNA_START=62 /DNA_END=635 /DNA_ORIENTATION=+